MRIILLCVVLVLGLNRFAAAEEDEFTPLFGNFSMNSSLGLSIKIPALEKKLETATVEFWLKGLADVRTVQELIDLDRTAKGLVKDVIVETKKQDGEEEHEWRVCDVVFYYYEKMVRTDGIIELDHDRFTRAEHDQFIKGAVESLMKRKLTDIPIRK